jgi:hypothetical protein
MHLTPCRFVEFLPGLQEIQTGMVDVTERRELNLQVREGRDPFEGSGKTGKADKGTDPH